MKSTIALSLTLLVAAVEPTPSAAQTIYSEDFTAPNGTPWPAPWFPVTQFVTVQDIQNNRARLNGLFSNVARMILPGFAETDVEGEVTVEFESVDEQGFGFYVRQNGGYLQQTTPFGQGYAMFLKGNWFWPQDLGLWNEVDGVEIQFAFGLNPVAGGLQSHVPYRIRYQVFQSTAASTVLRAKVWPAADVEPAAWTIEETNGHAVLQNVAASFAVDIYNASGAHPIFLDDFVLRRLTGASDAPLVRDAHGVAILARPMPMRAQGGGTIELALPGRGLATVRVYDAGGRLRATPVRDAPSVSDRLSIPWNGVDDAGVRLGAGVYFLRLESGGAEATTRVVLAR